MTRLMIYAQVPPPVHGQSVMAGHLIDGLHEAHQIDLESRSSGNASASIAFCHVNPRISEDLGDIGRWRPRKLFLVFRYIFAAIRARFLHGLDTFYFVPAPPKRGALYRDWCVLLLCRPFYRRIVLHWHCIGQPEFMEKKLSAPERFLARWIYGGAALSIVLSHYSRGKAAYFNSARTEVVPNGIPDPCPEFDAEVWPRRQARAKALASAHQRKGDPCYYEVLFLAGRMTPKGLFDAMAAITRANHLLAEQNLPLRVRLTVAGSFDDSEERGRFHDAAKVLNLAHLPGKSDPLALYIGWASEEKKKLLFRGADCLIFPTFYPAESFGLVLAEAMAHGCAVITTRWQAVPEVLPPGDPNVVEPHNIEAMAAALLHCAAAPASRELRDYFLAHFTSERFVQDMVRVLSDV